MMNDGGAETFRFIGCCDNVPCACAANRFIASQVPPATASNSPEPARILIFRVAMTGFLKA